MSRESRLRLKLKSALEDIDRMEKGNYSQLLLRKKEEAFDLIIDLKNAWGISLEEIREDETYQTPRQLYDKLCAVKVREDRNDFARKVLAACEATPSAPSASASADTPGVIDVEADFVAKLMKTINEKLVDDGVHDAGAEETAGHASRRRFYCDGRGTGGPYRRRRAAADEPRQAHHH